MTTQAPLDVPSFYLYGEPQRGVTDGFVHVESLDDRSRPSEWTIRPHVHQDLNHVILIAEGGGAMSAEGELSRFEAPCLLLIPAGMVHGFSWHSESRGWVTTIATRYLRDLLHRDVDLATLFDTVHAVPLPQSEGAMVEQRIEKLGQELSWQGAGQRAAVEAALLDLMVYALRHGEVIRAQLNASYRSKALVARLRQHIEQHFRRREQVALLARALGVSESRLRKTTAAIAGKSPAAMLDERALLEARRLLLYSTMSVSEIGYALGFDDPAYFSRFFARHVGHPPTIWRVVQNTSASPDDSQFA